MAWNHFTVNHLDYEMERLCSLKDSLEKHTLISRILEVHDTRSETSALRFSDCFEVYAEVLLTKLATKNILVTRKLKLSLACGHHYILNPASSHNYRIEITGKPHQAIRFQGYLALLTLRSTERGLNMLAKSNSPGLMAMVQTPWKLYKDIASPESSHESVDAGIERSVVNGAT